MPGSPRLASPQLNSTHLTSPHLSAAIRPAPQTWSVQETEMKSPAPEPCVRGCDDPHIMKLANVMAPSPCTEVECCEVQFNHHLAVSSDCNLHILSEAPTLGLATLLSPHPGLCSWTCLACTTAGSTSLVEASCALTASLVMQ